MKNCTELPAGKLMVNKIPNKQQIYLIANFITKLLLVARKDIVLIVYNRLSKITYFIITTQRTLAEELARLFRDDIQKLPELLESVIYATICSKVDKKAEQDIEY